MSSETNMPWGEFGTSPMQFALDELTRRMKKERASKMQRVFWKTYTID